jgi:hypothetical protein
MQYVRHGFGRRKVGRNSAMPQVKRTSKGKRPSKAVSVLGIAGLSFAASTGGSPAEEIPSASLAAPTAGSAADVLWQNAAPFRVPSLDDEEISDVSLATFYLFNKENQGNSGSDIQLAVMRTGCGCGHGCGGCRGCGGVRACRVGGCGVGGCRGCRVGGCGGGCGVGWGGCGGCGGCGFGWVGGCCLSWGGCALC